MESLSDSDSFVTNNSYSQPLPAKREVLTIVPEYFRFSSTAPISVNASIMGEQSQAALLLRKQLAELNKNPVEGFSAGLIDDEDIFRWEVSRQINNKTCSANIPI